MEWVPLLMFVVVCLVLLSGYPVAFVLGGTALLFAAAGMVTGTFSPADLTFVPNRLFGIIDNTTLMAVPLFVFMGVMLEKSRVAEKLLASIYAASTDDVNAFAGKLSLLVEPRITDDRWYVFADPARIASMAYGYLASAQGVQIQRKDAWTTLGMEYRAFLDFGCGWTDWRGAYKNPGDS